MNYSRKRYNDDDIISIRDEQITIQRGEIVGILGSNGSGKTTFLKSILKLGDSHIGEVLVEGKPIEDQFEKVAFITEEGSYFPGMTPMEYGTFLADFFSRYDMDKYSRLLAYFDLKPYEKIKSFSRGQKSKLEICAGFSKGAKYILLDEPFLGKDMFSRMDFMKMMVATLLTDETILIASHFIDELENVIDRIIIFHNHNISGDYYTDDLRAKNQDLKTILEEISGYKKDKYREINM
ncbi:ABC transporter ATP-binding protein [Evansella sp. AB-P1]|uniref:ATP-binding cassette domain-containing protein n=1 Tax=Evansella sp. AB-P1 TaxID=3037653 RepID=UPI00241E55BE|nr:ABC transporter ATP-binding protein [Evansella sp. AB-P1]MDG5789069.1 ABC transporter ATP-binding protein [Evansella sp. AB-P1]